MMESGLGPTTLGTLLAGAQALINQALVYDPITRARLEQLEGRALKVVISSPRLEYCVLSADQQIKLLSYHESPATEIKGSAFALFGVLINGSKNLSGTEVEIRGSVGLVEQWQNLIRGLDIDWEDFFNQYLGDVFGHQVAEQVRSARQWHSQRQSNIHQQLVEYCVEELKLVPNRALFKDFCEQNQALRLTIDRAQARLEKLQQRMNEQASND